MKSPNRFRSFSLSLKGVPVRFWSVQILGACQKCGADAVKLRDVPEQGLELKCHACGESYIDAELTAEAVFNCVIEAARLRREG